MINSNHLMIFLLNCQRGGDVYDFHLHLQALSVWNRRWWNEVIVYMHGEDGQSSGVTVCDLQKLHSMFC